jgi:integrase
VDVLLSRYDAEHLACLSPDRRRTARRVLGQLQNRAGNHELARVSTDTLSRYLAALTESGCSAATVRKHRAVALAFAEWAYRTHAIDAPTLLALRAVRTPAGGPREPHPHPYNEHELRALRTTLDERWTLRPWDEREKWLQRVSEGRSPYSRVRVHAVGLQLRCVIALALHLGLRRGEIYQLKLNDLHFDNAGVVVGGSSEREVPFTSAAHFTAEQWLKCRSHLGAEHDRPWLNLNSGNTRSEPMTRHTFERLLSTYVAPCWNFKRLRDTCATAWARSGLRPEHLAQLLGLASAHDAHSYYQRASGTLERQMENLAGTFLAQVEPGNYAAPAPEVRPDVHTRGFCPRCQATYWRGVTHGLRR